MALFHSFLWLIFQCIYVLHHLYPFICWWTPRLPPRLAYCKQCWRWGTGVWVCVLIRSVMSNSLQPHDCSPPGSSVHGILQARILEWVAISCSRGSSWTRDQTHISSAHCTGRRMLYHCTTWGPIWGAHKQAWINHSPCPPGVHRLWEKQVCNRLLQYGVETFMIEVSGRCKVYVEDLGLGLGQFGKSVEWQPKLQRGPVATRIILGSIVSSPDSRPPGTSCCDLTWR